MGYDQKLKSWYIHNRERCHLANLDIGIINITSKIYRHSPLYVPPPISVSMIIHRYVLRSILLPEPPRSIGIFPVLYCQRTEYNTIIILPLNLGHRKLLLYSIPPIHISHTGLSGSKLDKRIIRITNDRIRYIIIIIGIIISKCPIPCGEPHELVG